MLDAARRAIDEDGADVVILGSTTMHQSHAFLAERLEVPVINPGLVGYKTCEMLLALGLTHSKATWLSPGSTMDGVFHGA
jgi:allantoin racemase